MENNILRNALWIWHSGKEDSVNQYLDFRTSFFWDGKQPLRLWISADSHYIVTVNGKIVDGSQFTDYPEYKIYDVLTITSQAERGNNLLCICAYCQNEDSFSYRKGTPGLLFCVESGGNVLAQSGGETLCRQSIDYSSGAIEKISMQMSYSFRYNAGKYDGWMEPDYICGKDWIPAETVSGSGSLFPRPIKMLNVAEASPALIQSQGVFFDTLPETAPCGDRMQQAALSFQPLCSGGGMHTVRDLSKENGRTFRAEKGNGIFVVLDIGKIETGFFDLEIDVAEGTEILIGWGEHLDDLRVRTGINNQFCGVYFSRGGRQSFCHRFKRIAGRYLQLQIYAKEAVLYSAGIRPVFYPASNLPDLEVPDLLHRRIFEVSRRTLELCMHEHYEDCPWREQALYGMDSAIQMMCGYYVFEGYEFAECSLRLLALGQREDGLLEICAPARYKDTIPSFSLHFIIALYENVARSKNIAFALEMLPVADKILSAFADRTDANGLVSSFPGYWNFYEWNDGLNGFPELNSSDPLLFELPLNAILSMALSAGESLHRLCNGAKAEQYAHSLQCVNKAMQMFWDTERGLFRTRLEKGAREQYHELTQALMVCCGGTDETQTDRVLAQLSLQSDDIIPATLSCHFYKYEALMRRPEKYGKTVAQDIARIWGEMLFAGATSFWEVAEGGWAFNRAGSLCHGWSAVPIYLYGRYGDYLFA